MLFKRIFLVAAAIALASLSGCNDKTSDYQLTDLYQISQLLTSDNLGKSIYPNTWLDIVDRTPQSPGTPPTSGSFVPSDYWVEIVAHKRSVPSAPDSCRADEYNRENPCAEIQVEEGTRAHVRNAVIADSLVCRYHIIDEDTRGVIVKDVTYSQNWYAMMAKLNADDAAYRGWAFYAVGGQWQRASSNAASPQLDSVVLEWGSQRFVSQPKVRSPYTPLKQLPRISEGESFEVTLYANTAEAASVPEDVYVSYEINGVMRHFLMDDLGGGRFQYLEAAESSRAGVGAYSQIVIEAFHPVALRDASPSKFGSFVWAMTYRVVD